MAHQLRKYLRRSLILRVLLVLPKADRKKIFAVVVLQVMFGLLDLLGIALIGIVGVLAVNGVSSQQPGSRVSAVLTLFNLETSSLQMQVSIIGTLASFVLLSKTAFTIIFTRKTIHFLSTRSAKVSSSLVGKLMSKPLTEIHSRTLQQTMYSLTTGVDSITLGIVSIGVNLIADVSLLTIIGAGLFLVDPIMAITTFLFFATLGFLLYRLLHKRASEIGLNRSKLYIHSSELIAEVVTTYREAFVRHRRGYYSDRISSVRYSLAAANAETSFMPSISKYIFEGGVILGALGICALQFSLHDAAHAVGILSIFLAASSRIAPAIMRLQQGAIVIKSNLGTSEPTLKLIEDLSDVSEVLSSKEILDFKHGGFSPEIRVSNLQVRYPESDEIVLKDISLEIKPGMVVALVGPSGSGKSTLVDAILGIIDPIGGEVFISGVSPIEAIEKWPGAIGYVPQDVVIVNGTFLENITLGFDITEESESNAERAVALAQLSEMLETLPEGINSMVGDRGTKISGGQRQRLGISRALFTNPKLLILDEATSALDGESESRLSSAIQQLKGSTTVLMIAHRLSTVTAADLVLYIDNGRILSSGSFDQVRKDIPDFDNQAKLMGL